MAAIGSSLLMVEGDANITLTGTVFDAGTKAPLDLTNYAIEIHVWNMEEEEPRTTLFGTIKDAAKGTFEVNVTQAFLAEPGNFEFELQLTNGPLVITAPDVKLVNVRPQRG